MIDPTHKKMLHIDPRLRGTVQTYSNTSIITDSASSATAYSTGFKTFDTAIGVDMEKKPLGTILEAAKARGMVIGMIVTSRVTHATPASFAAHIDDRDLENDIADQYCANINLDFLLGGGKRQFSDACLAIEFDNTVGVVKNFVYSNPNVAMISAADHGTGGITLGRDGVYKWLPELMVKQLMSTEWMESLFLNDRATYDEASALKKITDLITKNTATTEIPENWITIFKGEVKKIVAAPTRIAWTTTGHVGTDVNLYCAGPSVFTRRCNGNHDNTHVNEIMTNYLNLDLQPITLKLRGFKPNDDKTAPPPVTPSPMNAPTTKAP
ncbi:hypothetical protein LEN26_018335 [Aphanomyces euteiches]|nr:hypothetical protein LEN26_018335 [Aphanomyces euteiches]